MISGSIVALITPFTHAGAIDFSALEDLIRWQIEEGSDGLVLCGSTGEGSSLSLEEKYAIFEIGAKIGKGKIFLIANTGTNQTKESVTLTQEAKKRGMDASLAIIPYYNRPTEEGCYHHFAEIAAVELPLIVYYHPGRTALSLSAEALKRIFSIPQIIGVKEASGDFGLATQLLHQTQIPLFSGNDDLALPLLSLGGSGTISMIGNVIPGPWKRFVHSALKNEIDARNRFFESYDLCKALALETNPQCVKYAVSLMGKCESRFRLPLLEPKVENRRRIQEALEGYRMNRGLETLVRS